jgi:hypothetical protein
MVTISGHDDSLNVTLASNMISLRISTGRTIDCAGIGLTLRNSLGNQYVMSSTDPQGNAIVYVRPGLYSIELNPRSSMVPWSLTASIQSDTVLTDEVTPVRWAGMSLSSTTRSPISAEIYIRERGGSTRTGQVLSDSTGRFEALIRPGSAYEVTGSKYGYKNTKFYLTLDADSTFDLYLDPVPPTPAPPAAPDTPGRGSSGR